MSAKPPCRPAHSCRQVISCALRAPQVMRPAEVSVSQFEGIGKISLPAATFDGFGEDLEQFSAGHHFKLAPTVDDPTDMMVHAAASLTYTLRWLPPSVVFELQRFFSDPASPSVIHMTGLPVADDLPPTPTTNNVKELDIRLPATEVLLTGIGKVLGDPFLFNWHLQLAKANSFMYRLVPERIKAYASPKLLMHQDFSGKRQLDAFMLFCLRPDPSGEARTLVLDNRHLVAHLSPADCQLLRSHNVRGTQVTDTNGIGYEGPWYVLTGRPDDPDVNLYYDPSIGVVGETPEVTAAYHRCAELAQELAKPIFTARGDLLIINNRRALHGRSAFRPRWDGSDRWLAKMLVARPGRMHTGTAWPNVVV